MGSNLGIDGGDHNSTLPPTHPPPRTMSTPADRSLRAITTTHDRSRTHDIFEHVEIKESDSGAITMMGFADDPSVTSMSIQVHHTTDGSICVHTDVSRISSDDGRGGRVRPMYVDVWPIGLGSFGAIALSGRTRLVESTNEYDPVHIWLESIDTVLNNGSSSPQRWILRSLQSGEVTTFAIEDPIKYSAYAWLFSFNGKPTEFAHGARVQIAIKTEPFYTDGFLPKFLDFLEACTRNAVRLDLQLCTSESVNINSDVFERDVIKALSSRPDALTCITSFRLKRSDRLSLLTQEIARLIDQMPCIHTLVYEAVNCGPVTNPLNLETLRRIHEHLCCLVIRNAVFVNDPAYLSANIDPLLASSRMERIHISMPCTEEVCPLFAAALARPTRAHVRIFETGENALLSSFAHGARRFAPVSPDPNVRARAFWNRGHGSGHDVREWD